MSETAEAARARARGDLPRAPGFVALVSLAGGLTGLVLAAAGAGPELSHLAERSFGALDAAGAWTLAARLLWRLGLAPLVGAVVGLAIAQALLGAVAIRTRTRVRPSRSVAFPLAAALPVLAAPALTLWLLPRLLPRPDAGWVLLLAPGAALGLAAALLVPAAMMQRDRALRRWRERVEPEPPPRRDPDAPSPEVRAALRRLSTSAAADEPR